MGHKNAVHNINRANVPAKLRGTAQLRAAIWKAVSSEAQATDDKISLDEQDRTTRAAAEALDCVIVADLIIPGHSRWESDPIIALEEFERDGILAYHELRKLWQQRSIDVLICYNHSRLGRSFTMQSWVIENVIRSGARVYRVQGGWIDSTDYAWQIGMGGVLTTNEVERLVAGRRAAMPVRARLGLHTGSKPPLTHVILRDEKGTHLGMALDETRARLWQDLARLLLAGVAFNSMEIELFQLGHTRPNGKPYGHKTFYKLLYSPPTWGHLATGWNQQRGKHYVRLFGTWAFDEDEPPPHGAIVERNRIPPIYTGEQAEQVKAELRRRIALKGGSRPAATFRYSGLFICGHCGASMGYTHSGRGRVPMIRCNTPSRPHSARVCIPHHRILLRVIEPYMADLLRLIERGVTPDILHIENPDRDKAERVDLIAADSLRLQSQIATLIEQQSLQPPDVQQFYRESIARLVEQATNLNTQQLELQAVANAARRTQADEQAAADTLQIMGVDAFYQQDDRTINAWFHRYMGARRFVVWNSEIVRVVIPPKKRRKRDRRGGDV